MKGLDSWRKTDSWPGLMLMLALASACIAGLVFGPPAGIAVMVGYLFGVLA